MKSIFPIVFLLVSCGSSESKLSKFDELENREKAEKYVDSLRQAVTYQVMFDTIGVSNGPIKILKAGIERQEYSNYRNVNVSFKNVSDRKIEAIKIRWYGVDAFGEPADLGSSYERGFGGGFFDDPLRPGQQESATFNVLSRDAKKLVKAWPIEVVFEDGTKWESSSLK